MNFTPNTTIAPRPRLRLGLFAVEWLIIIVVAVYGAQRYLPFDPTLLLGGLEADWITSFAYHAAEGVQEQGRIPLWQPLLERGEPALESPVSSTLNPFSLFPSLIWGPEIGVRYSILIHFVIAGLGGWAIAQVLGFSTPARVLLGVIMALKGNMPAVAAMGYFQLSTTQAYLPWVVAGILAVARFRSHRTPVIFLGVALTLLYFGGTIYYMLPALILVGVLGLGYSLQWRGRAVHVDWAMLGRYIAALALTIALSAVTFLPLILQQAYFTGHPDELPTAYYETPITVLAQLFVPDRYYPWYVLSENYSLYVVPVWFAALLFIVLPPFVRRWNRPAQPRLAGRLLLIGSAIAVFFLFWGTGTNPIIDWAYANLPLIAQWRVLARMLTIVTLFLAVIVALRFDGLWRALVVMRPPGRRGVAALIAGGALVVVTGVAAAQPIGNFSDTFGNAYPLRPSFDILDNIVRFLRQRVDTPVVSLFGRQYDSFKPFYDYHIRYTSIDADLGYLPVASTLFPTTLYNSYAEYALIWHNDERVTLESVGYRLIPNIPHGGYGQYSPYRIGPSPMLMRYAEALPYAFAAPRDLLANYIAPEERILSRQTRALRASQVIPLPNYVHLTDHVVLAVQPSPTEAMVVTVQELAYPGWAVTVDGQPAPLESVGGLVGVTLQPGTAPQQIVFRYDPPLVKIGAVITLTTIALVVLWLLRADRVVRRRR